MVKSLAILAFIGATGATGALLAARPTVIDGKVMAADLMGRLHQGSFTAVACPERIPIEHSGAVFECTLTRDDGSTMRVEYTMTRAQNLQARVVDSTGPTREKVPASSDPWAN